MARVTYGAFITDLSGSIGGLTFQKNSSGNVARLKPKMPCNPSLLQSQQNNFLSGLISKWSALDNWVKHTWEDFASDYDHVNEWSEVKHLNGFQWFLSCNLNLLNVGESIINEAPGYSSLSAPNEFFLYADDANFVVEFYSEYWPETDYLVVYLTPPLRQSSMKMRKSTFSAGPLELIDNYYIYLEDIYANLFNINWHDLYVNSNCSIIVRIKTVQQLTGLASPFSSALIKLNP